MRFVDDRAMKGRARQRVVFPIEFRIDDHAARRTERRLAAWRQITVETVLIVGEAAVVPRFGAIERARIRIEEHDLRIEAQAALRIVRSVYAIAVALTGAKFGNVAVPDEAGAARQALARLDALRIEQAKLDGGGTFGIEGEVDARSVPAGAQGMRRAGEDADGDWLHQNKLQRFFESARECAADGRTWCFLHENFPGRIPIGRLPIGISALLS